MIHTTERANQRQSEPTGNLSPNDLGMINSETTPSMYVRGHPRDSVHAAQTAHRQTGLP